MKQQLPAKITNNLSADEYNFREIKLTTEKNLAYGWRIDSLDNI
jgi:hypothetical protein